MKKIKFIYLIFIFFSFIESYGQPYLNSWINFDQLYYKIGVREDGLFRITYEDLVSVDFPINAVNPQNLQIFFRGVEQEIFVSGENDRSIDPGDYIEFIGKRNDGFMNEFIHEPGSMQTNPYESLYTHTSYYFLTYTLEGELGKRWEVRNSNAPNGTEIPFLIEEEILSFRNYFSYGQVYPTNNTSLNEGAIDSRFNGPKGFSSPYFSPTRNGGANFELEIEDLFVNNNFLPRLELRVIGQSNTDHEVEILVGANLNSLRSLGRVTFEDYEGTIFESPLVFDDFDQASGKIFVRCQVIRLNRDYERATVPYVKITYPKSHNWNGSETQILSINESTRGNYTLFNNSNPNASYFLERSSKLVKINPFISDNQVSLSVAPFQSNDNLILASEFKTLYSFEKSEILNIPSAGYDYIILTHTDFTKPAEGTDNPIEAYKEYRSSEAGGNYNVFVATIGNVFDQFAYGEPTPFAITEFVKFFNDTNNPRFLFIVGKGLGMNVDYENRKDNVNFSFKNWIPPYGCIPSDNQFTAGIGNSNSIYPGIPIGRLACANSAQVVIYLNKVIEQESFGFDDLWKKRILHMVGGLNVRDNRQFQAYFDNLRSITENGIAGTKVLTVEKTTSNEIEYIDISDEVNRGLNIITLIGHAAGELTDVDIGDVTDETLGFKNRAKYPMVMINGCNSGRVFDNSITRGEQWTLAKNKGAVNFLAHSSFGYPDVLYLSTREFYTVAFDDDSFYYKPVGEIFQEATKRFINKYGDTNGRFIAQAQQNILQGDPAIKLFAPKKPDYSTKSNDISISSFIDGESLSNRLDSMRITIPINNFGIVDDSPFNIRVKRTFSDGTSSIFNSGFYNQISYSDTLALKIYPTEDEKDKSSGINQFEIFIDPNNSIDELNEENNIAVVEVSFNKGALLSIYPPNYGIVNETSLTLYSQSTNQDIPQRNYLFELDTSYLYNSPLKTSERITAGFTPTWSVSLPTANQDSITYFWRVRYADFLETDDTTWTESSFTFISNENSSGWIQKKFGQYIENNLDRISGDSLNQKLQFFSRNFTLNARTTGDQFIEPNNYFIEYEGSPVVDEAECSSFVTGVTGSLLSTTGLLLMVAIDKNTGELKIKRDWNWGVVTLHCGFGFPGSVSSIPSEFLGTTTNRFRDNDYITKLYNEVLNEGDYYALVSTGGMRWENHLLRNQTDLSTAVKLGINVEESLSNLKNGEPTIIFGQKDAPPNSAIEIYAENPDITGIPKREQVIEGSFSFSLDFDEGKMTSKRIGPAKRWSNIKFIKEANDSEIDTAKYDVIGVNFDGNEQVLSRNIDQNNFDISNVNSEEYPYIKLSLVLSDSANITPTKLRFWQVDYDPVPEGYIYYKDLFQQNISLEEGDTLRTTLAYKNISKVNFDSPIPVSIKMRNRATGQETLSWDTIPALASQDSALIPVKIPTFGWAGENKVTVNVNPKILPELVYENNFVDINFTVKKDQTNPLLDVLFDGQRITNGQIVSPKALVTINLKDNNRFLIKNDTTGFELALKANCDTCTFNRINLSNATWAQQGDNNFVVNHQLNNLSNGRYTLKVQGADVSGNLAGSNSYRVDFEVIRESSVTHFYPYPNPFSDNVRFIFTLTGVDVPDNITIQIMTVSGRVVKEITQEELGLVHIGNNITPYAWDGRDEFGDKLANGVYLYRVIIKKNGQNIAHRSTSKDGLFKNGIGKMYLLR